jgi:hypothetical protein
LVSRLLAATLTVVLLAVATSAAEDVAPISGEQVYQESAGNKPSVPAPGARSEWLPECAPNIVLAAIYKRDHEVRVIGYVRRALIGKELRLQSKLANNHTVLKFKSESNGYFNVKTRRPHHRVDGLAAWRVVSGKSRTDWVKLRRPLVLNNVHQDHGLLMVNAELNVKARSDTKLSVERLDDCKTPVSLGGIALSNDEGVIDGGVQLTDLEKPVVTFVRLRARVRSRITGMWGKTYYSLGLPVALGP